MLEGNTISVKVDIKSLLVEFYIFVQWDFRVDQECSHFFLWSHICCHFHLYLCIVVLFIHHRIPLFFVARFIYLLCYDRVKVSVFDFYGGYFQNNLTLILGKLQIFLCSLFNKNKEHSKLKKTII